MEICIQNEQLTVTADSLGGEPQSIRDKYPLRLPDPE